ncbi:lymphokine-activated killer T-cell-originated protein kinase [Dendroctonus ponderosae]
MSEFCTPQKHNQQLLSNLRIPPSPCMKKIGYGTGVAVYELQRSPAFNQFRSPWAIKKLIKRKNENGPIQTRLKNEAEVLRKLVHPNIVGFRAFLQGADGKSLLAMEECNSCLGDLIEDRNDNEAGPFGAKLISKVASDVAHALAYLHNTVLLLHCDLKSYNVLIQGQFQTCKLCDFGVCLPLTKDGELDKESAPCAEYEGTKAWSAPEILDYPQVITTKADIYSYGLIIWEMIALCPPISADLATDISSYSNLDPDTLADLLDEMRARERPAIPSNVNLGTDYSFLLEIYYCSTHENRNERPSASDLISLFQNTDVAGKQ